MSYCTVYVFGLTKKEDKYTNNFVYDKKLQLIEMYASPKNNICWTENLIYYYHTWPSKINKKYAEPIQTTLIINFQAKY